VFVGLGVEFILPVAKPRRLPSPVGADAALATVVPTRVGTDRLVAPATAEMAKRVAGKMKTDFIVQKCG